MGVASSSNTIKSMINTSMNVISTYEQICTVSKSQADIVFNISGNCQLTNDNIKIQDTQTIVQSCIQNNTTQNSLSSSVKQSMTQQAKAITQQFDFGTVGNAQNFIDQSAKLADTISQVYNQNCSVTGIQSNDSFTCSNNAKITNSVIQIGSYQSLTQNCLANNTSINDLTANLVTLLSQTATAQNQNTFAAFIYAFVAILAIVAWAGISIASTPLVQWAIVGLILVSIISTIIYTVTARDKGHYPYSKN
jgi:hypothetical protein